MQVARFFWIFNNLPESVDKYVVNKRKKEKIYLSDLTVAIVESDTYRTNCGRKGVGSLKCATVYRDDGVTIIKYPCRGKLQIFETIFWLRGNPHLYENLMKVLCFILFILLSVLTHISYEYSYHSPKLGIVAVADMVLLIIFFLYCSFLENPDKFLICVSIVYIGQLIVEPRLLIYMKWCYVALFAMIIFRVLKKFILRELYIAELTVYGEQSKISKFLSELSSKIGEPYSEQDIMSRFGKRMNKLMVLRERLVSRTIDPEEFYILLHAKPIPSRGPSRERLSVKLYSIDTHLVEFKEGVHVPLVFKESMKALSRISRLGYKHILNVAKVVKNEEHIRVDVKARDISVSITAYKLYEKFYGELAGKIGTLLAIIGIILIFVFPILFIKNLVFLLISCILATVVLFIGSELMTHDVLFLCIINIHGTARNISRFVKILMMLLEEEDPYYFDEEAYNHELAEEVGAKYGVDISNLREKWLKIIRGYAK